MSKKVLFRCFFAVLIFIFTIGLISISCYAEYWNPGDPTTMDGVGDNDSTDSTNDQQGNNNSDNNGSVEPEPITETNNNSQNNSSYYVPYVPPNYNYSGDNLLSRELIDSSGPISPEIKANSNNSNNPTINIESTKRFDLDFNNFQNWTIINGSWSSETDSSIVLRQLNSEDSCYAYSGLSNWTNYIVQTKIKFEYFAGSDQPFGLIARFKDIYNFYYVRISNSNTLEIRKIVNGSIMNVVSKTFYVQNNIWYNVKLKVFGNKLECYINDKLELSAEDPLLTSGQVGILIDNVKAEINDLKITLL